MKDLITGIIIGVSLGFILYYCTDGHLNRSAREASQQKLQAQQAQVDMLSKLCPEVLQKLQPEKK